MIRIPISVAAGLVGYVLLASVGLYVLRVSWSDYAAVEQSMRFDLPMQLARLLVSSVSLLAAAGLTGRIAPAARIAPLALGVILLVVFIPIHVGLWDKFPLWYHVSYLASLIALSLLGGTAGRRVAVPVSPG